MLELFCWRKGHQEVDFVLRTGRVVVAVEVKTVRVPVALPGLAAFGDAFTVKRVGPPGEFDRRSSALSQHTLQLAVTFSPWFPCRSRQ